MKRCPECRRDYFDDSLLYCLDDGASLLEGPGSLPGLEDSQTAILHETDAPGEAATKAFLHTTDVPVERARAKGSQTSGGTPWLRLSLIVAGLVLVLGGVFLGYRYFTTSTRQISSIAVMPFVNDSGNADNDYLTDGMTDTLISSLSQLQNLTVKARSAVFRYKGKAADPKTVGQELNAQAVLNGHVVQRGDQLTVNLELIDAQTENVIWAGKYDRKQSDLAAIQSEITREVLAKLSTKLSGTEEQKLDRTATTNPDAYRSLLQGRYFLDRTTKEDAEKAIGYFQQAIDLDP
ncbi:MAG: hypothetical protein JO314_08200, partial [Acidobacteria bacterium]|nr:hypothetical protein [Acidobacteriota bacterium]